MGGSGNRLVETKGDASRETQDTCGRDVRAAAHLQQLERVAVVGHQDLERRVVHRSVVDLQRRQRFGVDEHHGQRRDEVGLWTERDDESQSAYRGEEVKMGQLDSLLRSRHKPSSLFQTFSNTDALIAPMSLSMNEKKCLSYSVQERHNWKQLE